MCGGIVAVAHCVEARACGNTREPKTASRGGSQVLVVRCWQSKVEGRGSVDEHTCLMRTSNEDLRNG